VAGPHGRNAKGIRVNCQADLDVWLRPGVKASGEKVWNYILCYVDDILCIHTDPKLVMDFLVSKYTLKKGSVQEPDLYLGAQISKWNIAGSDDPTKTRWAMSSSLYVKRAIDDVETELAKIDKQLPTKCTAPMYGGYRLECNQSAELETRKAQATIKG
jgi:hypothetical protein